MSKTLETLENFLREAFKKSLPELSLDLGAIPELKDQMLTSIAFDSPHLRGKALITSSQSFLRQSCPIDLNPGEDHTAVLQDWLGELGNLVMGRFKNTLLAHGVVIRIHPPQDRSASAELQGQIRFAYHAQGQSAALICSLECGELELKASSNPTDLMPGDAVYRLNEPAHLKKNYDVISKIRSGMAGEDEAFTDDLDEDAASHWEDQDHASLPLVTTDDERRELESVSWDRNGVLELCFAGDLRYTLCPAALVTQGRGPLKIEGYQIEITLLGSNIRVGIPALRIEMSQEFKAAA